MLSIALAVGMRDVKTSDTIRFYSYIHYMNRPILRQLKRLTRPFHINFPSKVSLTSSIKGTGHVIIKNNCSLNSTLTK